MTTDMTTEPTDAELERIRARTRDRLHRCVALLLDAVARDWRHCGKAACLRSRRCHGLACKDLACEDPAGAPDRGCGARSNR